MTAVLVTCIGLMSLHFLPSGHADKCQMDVVRSSAAKSLLGGWRAAQPDNAAVVKLTKAATVEARTSKDVGAALSRDHHVIEAFTQLVNGNNYCVRFSAAGECNDYHCKSYECIAKGHQPIASTEVSVSGIECNEMQVCNIEGVRASWNRSQSSPMVGAWSRVNKPYENERVVSLHQTASAIASVDKGPVVEAYSQVVAGNNYCIQFTAKASGNCGQHCKDLKCVAGGFDPLPQEKGNIVEMTQIGVQCEPGDREDSVLRLASSYSSAGRHLPAVTMTTLLATMVAVVVHLG